VVGRGQGGSIRTISACIPNRSCIFVHSCVSYRRINKLDSTILQNREMSLLLVISGQLYVKDFEV